MAGTISFGTKMTAAAYLEWERTQRDKHQLIDGEVFAMAGGSPRHNHLSANLLRELGNQLRGGPCRTFTSDQKVHVPTSESFVYPDVTVVCGAIELRDDSDAIVNPTTVIEVLSKSTEPHDRGDKWKDYQTLSSLEDYVLVSQRVPRIEQFRRDAGGAWTYRVAGAGGRIELSTGAVIAVDHVYEGAFDLPGDD